MFQKARPLFLICETPMHAGSGDDLGVVDLPIQRERHTSFPKIEASSLKGALREAFENYILNLSQDPETLKKGIKKLNQAFGFDESGLRNFSKEQLKALFEGEETDEKGEKKKTTNTEFAGALGFSDARLLLFPVKSMKGVFAWVTCERVLRKFKEDLMLCKEADAELFKSITNLITISEDIQKDGKCYASHEKVQIVGKEKSHIVLEEYAFEVMKNEANFDVVKLASELQNQINAIFPITERLVVLSNNDFKDFVNLSTEVITRTKIDNSTGTVQSGALFTEEFLPAESVMYSLVLASNVFGKQVSDDFKTAENVLNFFDKIPEVVQIGGNATLGKGITRTKFLFNETQKGGAK